LISEVDFAEFLSKLFWFTIHYQFTINSLSIHYQFTINSLIKSLALHKYFASLSICSLSTCSLTICLLLMTYCTLLLNTTFIHQTNLDLFKW